MQVVYQFVLSLSIYTLPRLWINLHLIFEELFTLIDLDLHIYSWIIDFQKILSYYGFHEFINAFFND